jgi:streptomycin 6-kinase
MTRRRRGLSIDVPSFPIATETGDKSACSSPVSLVSVRVPEVVRNKALAAGAAAWLDELPGLIADLERDWDITVGRPFPGATEALVAEASGPGPGAVLKLMIPRPGDHARNEITVLRLAGGDGCARLLRADEARGALLIERLGPSLYDLGLPLARRLEILCATASRLWRPVPPECVLPTGAEKARWLIGYVESTWPALGRPCSERAVDYALACAARRAEAHDDERAVLVHGDVHQWNVLEAPPGDEHQPGFKLVDPDGLLAEAECDLGVLMREDPVELRRDPGGGPWARARWLARRCGLDATAIWEWGAVERVSTGLLCTLIDLQPVGREMLATADYVAARPPAPA